MAMVMGHSNRAVAWVCALALAVGSVAIGMSSIGRSLWHDEAWMVRTAGERDAVGVLAVQISERQPVAPGYLLLLHGMAGGQARGAWPYRLPAIAFGAAAVVLAGWMLGRVGGSTAWGMAGAAALLACPIVQRYMGEVKHYMASAACSMAVLAAAGAWARSRRPVAAWAWFTASLATVVLSCAGWFVIAGTGAVLMAAWARRGDGGELRRLAVMGTGVLAVAAVVYVMVLGPIHADPALQAYWGDRTARSSGEAWRSLPRLVAELMEQAWYRYDVWGAGMVAGAAAGWGVWWAWDRWGAAMAGASMLVTLLASVLLGWPLGVRVNLPLVLMLHMGLLAGVMGGVAWAARWLRGGGDRASWHGAGWSAAMALGVTLVLGVLAVREGTRADFEVAQVNQLLDALEVRRTPGEDVYMDTSAWMGQLVRHGAAGAGEQTETGSSGGIGPDVARRVASGHGKTVWIALGHFNLRTQAQCDQLAAALRPHGEWTTAWQGRLAALHRYVPFDSGGAGTRVGVTAPPATGGKETR